MVNGYNNHHMGISGELEVVVQMVNKLVKVK